MVAWSIRFDVLDAAGARHEGTRELGGHFTPLQAGKYAVEQAVAKVKPADVVAITITLSR